MPNETQLVAPKAKRRRPTGLEVLALNNTQVTNAGIHHLKPLTAIELLDLGNTQVSDAGVDHLKQLPGLQELSLFNTKVSGAGLAELRAALPDCKIVEP